MNTLPRRATSEMPITALDDFPAEWRSDPWKEIVQGVATSRQKLVVLDDDPTGTQTVHDVAVLTRWDVTALERELRKPANVFYILTNSRSLPESAAIALTRDIGLNLRAAAIRAHCEISVVSRSDSTLRGHFPADMDTLSACLSQRRAPWLLVPYFEAGGRRTIGDVHYLTEGNALIPVGETVFATDPVFGYRASNLRDWVEEKTKGRIRAETVHSISLDHIRIGGPESVRQILAGLPAASVCVVNAATPRDLETFVLGLLQAEADGSRFLYRTAASFVATRAGIRGHPLIQPAELKLPSEGGGLIVVGSHVERTTEQVEKLLARRQISALTVDAGKLLEGKSRTDEISRVAAAANAGLAANREVLVYTSRSLITGPSPGHSLAIAQSVSEALVAIVQAISIRPRYLLAKGGITSSDLAVKALGVERAMVIGQFLPGVPVWRLEAPARWPDLAYIVFPGNVGERDALLQAIERLGLPERSA